MELSDNGLFLTTNVLEMRDNGHKGQSIRIETPTPLLEPFHSKGFSHMQNLKTGLPTGCAITKGSTVSLSNRGEINREKTPSCGPCRLRCNSAYPEGQLIDRITKRINR